MSFDTEKHSQLVVFDVEGVIIPKERFILFEILGRMGFLLFFKAVIYGLLYEIGFVSLKKSLINVYSLFKGLSLEQFIVLFNKVPLMPGVEDTLDDLKKSGLRIALISSGIPRLALEKLAESIGANYVSGPEIGVSGGRLTGEIWGDVVESQGKGAVLRKILDDEHLLPCGCVVVADDRNNLPLFQLCKLRVGYNPDYVLSRKSDFIVKGELKEILPIIKGNYKEEAGSLSIRSILRATIHICGFLVPLVCVFLANRYLVSSAILLVTLLYIISETKRMLGSSTPFFSDLTSKAARNIEFQEFVTSPIFYAFGIILSLVLFPIPIGYVSISVLTLGDGFASIFGSAMGRNKIPFNKNKKLEGTIAGFIFAFCGSLLYVNPLQAFAASLVGMLIEMLPLPLNDNLTVPLASGLALLAMALR